VPLVAEAEEAGSNVFGTGAGSTVTRLVHGCVGVGTVGCSLLTRTNRQLVLLNADGDDAKDDDASGSPVHHHRDWGACSMAATGSEKESSPSPSSTMSPMLLEMIMSVNTDNY